MFKRFARLGLRMHSWQCFKQASGGGKLHSVLYTLSTPDQHLQSGLALARLSHPLHGAGRPAAAAYIHVLACLSSSSSVVQKSKPANYQPGLM